MGKQVWMIKQSAWGHIAEELAFELGLTGGAVVRNLTAKTGDTEIWVRSLGWEDTLEILVGYSPWGCKGSDKTQH